MAGHGRHAVAARLGLAHRRAAGRDGLASSTTCTPCPPRRAWRSTAIGAILLTIVGVQERELPLLLALPLAFVWIALVTNVYNFMDGIDGLAASQAVIAGLALLAAGAIVGNPLIGITAGLIAAASAGFLVHNLPPARLFMGDVGSTFLGFSFAALALLGNLGVGGGRLPIEFGIVILAPFLFDSIVTLARRVARGERWYAAHRSHYYQRLVVRGAVARAGHRAVRRAGGHRGRGARWSDCKRASRCARRWRWPRTRPCWPWSRWCGDWRRSNVVTPGRS